MHISSGSKLCWSCSGILSGYRTTWTKRFNCSALLNLDGLCGSEEAIKYPLAKKVFQVDGRWVHPLFTNGQTRGELKGRISCQRPHLAIDYPCGKLPGDACPQPTWGNWGSCGWDLAGGRAPWRNICINSRWMMRASSEKLAEAHRQKPITVISVLGEREMRYSVLLFGSEEAHTEQFGENWMIPMIKEKKGREALSDPQVCVVTQSSPWCPWQDVESDVNLKNKKWRKQEIWKKKTVGHGEGKEPKWLRGHQTSLNAKWKDQ